MMGNAPTGKSFTIFGFWMHRFEGDKIAEEWAAFDTHGFLAQLGVSVP
jgi:predicted ester cyclase